MKKDFVMRGQTASTAGLNTEVLNFSGFKPGMAYRLVEFKLYPANSVNTADNECLGTITAGKTAVDPENPDFNDEGLIAVASFNAHNSVAYGPLHYSVVNDTFLITQNLILQVRETASGNRPVNWQCRFETVKLTGPEEAVANYKQYTISDE